MPLDPRSTRPPLTARMATAGDTSDAAPFYEDALPSAARPSYRRALRTHGLDGEIALLRLRLRALLAAERPVTTEGSSAPDAQTTGHILRIVDLLVKAARLAPARDEDQAALERALDAETLRVLSSAAPHDPRP